MFFSQIRTVKEKRPEKKEWTYHWPSLGFLLFRQGFCYDHMAAQSLQVCFLFACSFNVNCNASCDVIFHS